MLYDRRLGVDGPGVRGEHQRRVDRSRPTCWTRRQSRPRRTRRSLVLHCLPAHRGEEIAAGPSMDGPRSSVVWDEVGEPAARAEGAPDLAVLLRGLAEVTVRDRSAAARVAPLTKAARQARHRRAAVADQPGRAARPSSAELLAAGGHRQVTQATLSRDLDELGAVKTRTSLGLAYVRPCRGPRPRGRQSRHGGRAPGPPACGGDARLAPSGRPATSSWSGRHARWRHRCSGQRLRPRHGLRRASPAPWPGDDTVLLVLPPTAQRRLPVRTTAGRLLRLAEGTPPRARRPPRPAPPPWRPHMSDRIVLAYSGGLDTSVAIGWIAAETGAGRSIVRRGRRRPGRRGPRRHPPACPRLRGRRGGRGSTCKRRVRRGATACPRCRPNALYMGRVPARVRAESRPLIATHLVKRRPASTAPTTVAHGCTGKGNDQVRFEVGHRRPSLLTSPSLAPVRDSGMTRDKAIAFAEERGSADRDRASGQPVQRSTRTSGDARSRPASSRTRGTRRSRTSTPTRPGAGRRPPRPTRCSSGSTEGRAGEPRTTACRSACCSARRGAQPPSRRAGRRAARHGRGPAGRHQEP